MNRHFAVPALLCALLANLASAQNSTLFAMIGVTRDQTLNIHVIAFPPDPCYARLAFQDSAGMALGPATDVALLPGQSAALALNVNALVTAPGQRVEVLPKVVPTVVLGANTEPNHCVATVEVTDNLLQLTGLFIPGLPGVAANPAPGLFSITVFQTARLNVVAFPPDPCTGEISFVDAQGAQVGPALALNLAPGEAQFLDLRGSTLNTRLGQRAELRPVVVSPNGGDCVISTEIYSSELGSTTGYFPPDPCGPSSCLSQ
jgi:hypothetical protein